MYDLGPFDPDGFMDALCVDESCTQMININRYPYKQFNPRITASGMGVGRLKKREMHGPGHERWDSYSMKLLHWEAIVTNGETPEYWDILAEKMVGPINRLCRAFDIPGKIDMYICTQSNKYLSRYADLMDDRLNFIEINGGSKPTRAYEYYLKESVGRLVTDKLVIEEEPRVVNALFGKIARDAVIKGAVWDVKENLKANDDLVRLIRKDVWQKGPGSEVTQTKIRKRRQ
jgi:hypothetical protein